MDGPLSIKETKILRATLPYLLLGDIKETPQNFN